MLMQGNVMRSGKQSVDLIAHGGNAVLSANLLADSRGFLSVRGIVEQAPQFTRGARDGVTIAADNTPHTQTSDARCVVGLVVAKRHDQHRHAGLERLPGRARAALMHNSRSARENF